MTAAAKRRPDKGDKTMTHVVFICTANICRSPMAEGIFRHKADLTGRGDLTTASMGIHGLPDEPASEPAREVCEAHGIDISAHRSRSISGEELQQSDLILCMEPGHRKFVQTFFPWHRQRVFLLGAWPGKQTRKSVIKDPIGAPMAVYRMIFEVIDKHIDRIWEHL